MPDRVASLVPQVIDRLVELATDALPNALVMDGFGLTEDPGDFLMIGVEDPDTQDFANSAESSQEWATCGQGVENRDEDGVINCASVSWNGDNDQKFARDNAYAMASALWNAIQDEAVASGDVGLGIPGLLWLEFRSAPLNQAMDEKGALAQVIFQIRFRARI